MRITGIANTPKTYNYQHNISFKGDKEHSIDKKILRQYIQECREENYNDAYNREYVPLVYDKTILAEPKPSVLPSQRYIKHSSTFRDEELFDDYNDTTYYCKPSKYDIEDIPIDQRLWQKYVKPNDEDLYYGIDTTLISEDICSYEGLKQPWITKEERLAKEREEEVKRILIDKIQETTGNYKTTKKILKSASLTTNSGIKINESLCRLATDLFKNSKQWTDTEEDIMKNIKIEMYQKNYVDYSHKKYKYVEKCLIMDYENEKILNNLKRKFGKLSLDFESMFTEEELKDFM